MIAAMDALIEAWDPQVRPELLCVSLPLRVISDCHFAVQLNQQPLYTRFIPIIFSSCFPKVPIGFIPILTSCIPASVGVHTSPVTCVGCY
jgi:hypothetical protein